MIKIYEAKTYRIEGRNRSTMITGDFNAPLSILDKTTRQELSKEIEGLSNTMHQLHPTDVYRTPHPTTAYTFFSSVHVAFSRTDHILGHKANTDRSKKIGIIQSIFSDHNRMKLGISNRRKTGKFTKFWELDNKHFLKNVYLFIYFERESVREQVSARGEGQRERERERESHAASSLSAKSLMQGLSS